MVTSQWTVECHIVVKLVPNTNTNTIPSGAFLNAEPADKRNKKSSNLGNENVQNLQNSETHNTGDSVIYLPGENN